MTVPPAPGTGAAPRDGRPPSGSFERPYVVSWNLTYRCNLACEHCYLDAGAAPAVRDDDAFADRRELSTAQCCKVIDDIVSFAPEALTILTGGEPLLRRDIVEIVRYANRRGLWVVVGTNGVLVTDPLARLLQAEGVRGLSLSLDALDAGRHDRFRRVRGAFDNTVRGARVLAAVGLPFIVQTTAGAHNQGELEAIAEFAHRELGAKVWNLYFLVPSGRGQFVSDLSAEQYDRVLEALERIQRAYAGRMVVNAKCAPHFVRQLLSSDPTSPFLRTYSGGAGGCPAGTHYLGIRPNGDVTPCPYLPLFAGNLQQRSLAELWHDAELFKTVRQRTRLGGRCGECELGAVCGGCRARAYSATGDVLAEDPLCSHVPGTVSHLVPLLRGELVYGESPRAPAIDWEPEARQRMERVPAFVRGMVIARVERYCGERGIRRVTAAELETIRAAMPTPKFFGKN